MKTASLNENRIVDSGSNTETLIVAALIYFVLTYVMSKLLALLEGRLRRSERTTD